MLIPFYGKWPVYFQLYLKSCAYNPALKIFFITDLELPKETPSNVEKIHIAFSDLASLFSDKLGTNVALNSYYKLCDFKPAYGFLFEDYIKEFDFWGFGDIDLVYGKIDEFITDEILEKNDVITFRTEWLSGALTLFRNNAEINSLFKESPDWQKVITDRRHFSFTECATQYGEVLRKGSIFNVKMEIVPMTVVVKKAALEKRLRLFEEKLIKESIVNNDFVHFLDGEVKDNFGKGYLHYHFVTEKSKSTFSYPTWKVAPSSFYITRFGFFHDIHSPVTSIIKLFRLIKSKRITIGKKLTLQPKRNTAKH